MTYEIASGVSFMISSEPEAKVSGFKGSLRIRKECVLDHNYTSSKSDIFNIC